MDYPQSEARRQALKWRHEARKAEMIELARAHGIELELVTLDLVAMTHETWTQIAEMLQGRMSLGRGGPDGLGQGVLPGDLFPPSK